MANPQHVLSLTTAQGMKSADFKDIYTNNVRLGISPNDFFVTFGKVIEQSVGVNAIEEQAVVRMSPQQFKAFVESAKNMMAAWEESFGTITISAKIQDQKALSEGIKRLKDSLNIANS